MDNSAMISRLMTERGIKHDVFHFTSGHWEIRYRLPNQQYRQKVGPKSLVADQTWLDLPVLEDSNCVH